MTSDLIKGLVPTCKGLVPTNNKNRYVPIIHISLFLIENHCNSNSPYDSQSDSLENSFVNLSVNDVSQESSGSEDTFVNLSVNDVVQESSGSEEQDVKMSVAVSEDKSCKRQAKLGRNLEAVVPPEPSVSNHL